MSNYHIGLKTVDNRYADLYVHLPIPSSETTAGQALAGETITYRDAVKGTVPRDDAGNPVYTQIPDLLQSVEITQLEDGELFEKYIQFRFDSPDLTNAERRAQIEAGNGNQIGVIQMLADISTSGTDLYNEIIEPLEWWGYHRHI